MDIYVVYDLAWDGDDVVVEFVGAYRERWQAVLEADLRKCLWAEVEVAG